MAMVHPTEKSCNPRARNHKLFDLSGREHEFSTGAAVAGVFLHPIPPFRRHDRLELSTKKEITQWKFQGGPPGNFSTSRATLAPRSTLPGALPGRAESMRLPASSAASLLGREHDFHSARHGLPYVPESPPASPEPYVPPEAARHNSAYATHTTRFDAAPRRKGGFMSGLKKGLKALGFGSSRRSDSSSGAPSSSTRHGIDASMRRDSVFRMDAPSPGRGLPQHTHDEAVDAQVTQHDSPPAEAPVPQPPRASRRRQRDDEDWESSRRVAGSAMRAQATTLPPPDPARRKDAHAGDLPLIERARAGLAATPGLPQRTRQEKVNALIGLSAWLQQVGKPAMQGRLFSKELTFDAWKFVRLGGHPNATSALTQFRNAQTSPTGLWEIARELHRGNRDVPQADRTLIQAAFGTETKYRLAALAFSEWLAREQLPALTEHIADDDGGTRAALHTDDMTHFAEAYKQSPGAQHVKSIAGALTQLQTFDRTGATNIKRYSHYLAVPEVDQRLISRYREEGNKQLREKARRENRPVKEGHTVVDKYARVLRAFSESRQQEELPTIAARLHDATLRNQVELFADRKSFNYRAVQTALKAMVTMFPQEAPEVTIARIGRERLVNALEALAPNMNVTDVAQTVGANVDDLLVFLDARADDGLTQATTGRPARCSKARTRSSASSARSTPTPAMGSIRARRSRRLPALPAARMRRMASRPPAPRRRSLQAGPRGGSRPWHRISGTSSATGSMATAMPPRN